MRRLQLLVDLALLAIVVVCGSLLLTSLVKTVYQVLSEPVLIP